MVFLVFRRFLEHPSVILLPMSQSLIMPVTTRFDDPSTNQASQQLPDHVRVAAADIANLAATAAQGNTWTLSGSGIFSWSVFRLYKASLFVQGSIDSGLPYALELSYLRRVTAQQIADASVQQMQRLGFGQSEQLQAWHEQLLGLLPDVALGDRLIGLFVPGREVVFFDATTRLGLIDDPVFTEGFAAIWLDPRTEGQALRRALLGLAR